MALKFHCPTFKMGHNPPAVYRLVFDTGHFYIGSSKKIKTRFTLWRTTLKRTAFSNKNIKQLLPSFSEVFMEIIEFTTKAETRIRENYYINKNIGDPLFLNKHKTALGDGSNKKQSQQEWHKAHYVPRPRKIKKPKVYKPPQNKPVVKFSKTGEFIERYNSIADAIRSVGVHERTFSKHLKRTRIISGMKGFVFRLEDDKRPYTIGRKPPKPKKDFLEMSAGRFVLDINTGVFYYSVRDLCDLIGVKEKQMYKKLSGTAKNNTQYRYV